MYTTKNKFKEKSISNMLKLDENINCVNLQNM